MAIATAIEMDGMPYLFGGNGPRTEASIAPARWHYILRNVGSHAAAHLFRPVSLGEGKRNFTLSQRPRGIRSTRISRI